MDDVLESAWRRRWDVDLSSVHVLRAELNPDKRTFLKQQFRDMSFLVGDMEGLSMDRAFDYISESDRVVPHFTSLGTGFPCVSRTPVSVQMRQNLNCCQRGTATTGLAVRMILTIVARNWPEEIIKECVVQLDQRSDATVPSDAEWITSELRKLGYWAVHTTVQASTQLSPLPRQRLWWVALKGIAPDFHDEATEYFLDKLPIFFENFNS